MKRLFLTLAAVLLATTAARAHFIFIVPEATTPGKASVVFSDSLAPDENPALLAKIAQTKLFLRDAAGKTTPLTWEKGEKAYHLTLPSGAACTVGGECLYGVFQRGDNPPMLLKYFPKLIQGPASAKAWDQLPLEIVPTAAAARFVVLYQGKPLADAEVNYLAPGGEKAEAIKTDANGEFTIPNAKLGLYGIRALHVAKQAGEHEGKKYEAVRTYATLVLNLGTGVGK
jgi:uncharacterized GH25 family protein